MTQRYSLNPDSSSLRDRHPGNGDNYYISGSTPSVSGRSSPFNGNAYAASPYGNAARQRSVEELESQNDEEFDGLSAKVKLLKDITVGIGKEIRDSTVQLSQMNDTFEETTGILSGTFRRMNRMSSRQGCRWLWYIVFLVFVFWFFIIVWWFRR